MIPQHLIERIANQNAVFFCGAGISGGVEGERGFPGGRDLARDMAEKLLGRTVRDEESLAQIAQEVIWDDNERRSRLNEYLLQVFADPTIKPLRAHKALADLECNVITTNYDTLIEDAFKQAEKRCGTVVRENDLTRMRDVNVVKVHGCVTDVDNIVIAEEDYYRWLTSDSEMKTLVRLWFFQHHIIFVGFSLSDPNFRQLYYDLRLRFGEALKVAHAVFKEKSDNYDMRFIEKQGITIIEQDATVFLEDLVGQVVLPQALEKYGPMACARIYRDWLDADPGHTRGNLAKLAGLSEGEISRILTLLGLPNRYQKLVENRTIKSYHGAVYVQRILEKLDERGELLERGDEIYEWVRTGPSYREAMKCYEQLKAGKSWSELEHK
jgi:NAD-dependent SIR2 family protein deacetylase